MEENVKNLDEQKTTSTIKIKIEVKSLKIRSERHGEAEMTPINKQENSFDINIDIDANKLKSNNMMKLVGDQVSSFIKDSLEKADD
jgi:hypothetical protein